MKNWFCQCDEWIIIPSNTSRDACIFLDCSSFISPFLKKITLSKNEFHWMEWRDFSITFFIGFPWFITWLYRVVPNSTVSLDCVEFFFTGRVTCFCSSGNVAGWGDVAPDRQFQQHTGSQRTVRDVGARISSRHETLQPTRKPLRFRSRCPPVPVRIGRPAGALVRIHTNLLIATRIVFFRFRRAQEESAEPWWCVLPRPRTSPLRNGHVSRIHQSERGPGRSPSLLERVALEPPRGYPSGGPPGLPLHSAERAAQ